MSSLRVWVTKQKKNKKRIIFMRILYFCCCVGIWMLQFHFFFIMLGRNRAGIHDTYHQAEQPPSAKWCPRMQHCYHSNDIVSRVLVTPPPVEAGLTVLYTYIYVHNIYTFFFIKRLQALSPQKTAWNQRIATSFPKRCRSRCRRIIVSLLYYKVH